MQTDARTKGLPYGTRFYFKKKGKGILIVEHKPMTRHVLLHGCTHALHLSFPYVVYAIPFHTRLAIIKCCSQIYVGFRNHPLQSLDDLIGRPPLPNTYWQGRVCLDINYKWV